MDLNGSAVWALALESAHFPGLLQHQARQIGGQVAWRVAGAQLTIFQWQKQAERLSEALIHQGVEPGEPVGLWMSDGLAWPVALFGIWGAGAVALPLSAGLSPGAVAETLRRAGAGRVLVDRPGQLGQARLVPFGPPGDGLPGPRPWRGGTVAAGAERLVRMARLNRQSPALAAPTSGTTGKPRLAMLSHHNLLASAGARAMLVKHQPGDLVLSWLPLAHLYALNADILKGIICGVAAARLPHPAGLFRALRRWRPTHLQAVPRLYEKAWRLAGGENANPESLQAIFGSRLRWAGCGGAPLPAWLAAGYARLGIPILEGYGLTEASPLVTLNTPGACCPGTAGRVVPGMEVTLAADGEILVRGDGVMRGYLGADGRIDPHTGWLATGDLGAWREGGFLRVDGRKSETIVLSTGRKVMPAKVEAALAALPGVDSAVVLGEGRPRVLALVLPRPGVSLDWSRLGNLDGLESWEQPARLIVLPRPLSAEWGELTPLGKVRRDVVASHFRDLLPPLAGP